MEELLKRELGTSRLEPYGFGGGGCISSGQGYVTDTGRIFAKHNSKSEARRMFDGEYASLEAIDKTETIRAPKPIKVIDQPSGGAVLVAEYVDIKSLSKYASQLGEQLAQMHLYNDEVGKRLSLQESSVHKDESLEYVSRFGFPVTTCCGYLPQDNTWQDDWVVFFTRQKLQQQLDLIEKEYGDREARELWPQLLRKIPDFFKGIDIKPALLHGDLWGGNLGECDTGPVIFDPACFYGHHEYELGIMMMFGGSGSQTLTPYHKLIPKSPRFEERHKLYQLFHYLNHWNHFGGSYRHQSIGIMRSLIKK
ncbi:unnamed protein product [Owenia fusiformis]|uniref:protein-ribulosamine 3-kinase n=1 Tax=Owenia fusiformis TaxID=6347 RepID=A0A8S4Q3E3_OWEFU|nr:unnamed protein product [Owenia fusiformis]